MMRHEGSYTALSPSWFSPHPLRAAHRAFSIYRRFRCIIYSGCGVPYSDSKGHQVCSFVLVNVSLELGLAHEPENISVRALVYVGGLRIIPEQNPFPLDSMLLPPGPPHAPPGSYTNMRTAPVIQALIHLRPLCWLNKASTYALTRAGHVMYVHMYARTMVLAIGYLDCVARL